MIFFFLYCDPKRTSYGVIDRLGLRHPRNSDAVWTVKHLKTPLANKAPVSMDGGDWRKTPCGFRLVTKKKQPRIWEKMP